MKLLALPVPVLAALAAVQIDPPGAPEIQGPEWLIGALFALWLVIWFLDKIGRLPFVNVQTVGFRGVDRMKLDKVHDLLAQEDNDGVTRFNRHVIETHKAVERQKIYVDTQERIERLMERQDETLKRQTEISRQHNQLVGLLTDQLRVMGQRLDAIERAHGGGAA